MGFRFLRVGWFEGAVRCGSFFVNNLRLFGFKFWAVGREMSVVKVVGNGFAESWG